jgi:hypothetical protein
MVSILDDLSVVTTNRAEFVVTAPTIEELMDSTAANLVVQKAASAGLNRPGVSNAGGPYPVDESGNTDNDLLLGKRGPIAGYRRDFVVLGSI